MVEHERTRKDIEKDFRHGIHGRTRKKENNKAFVSFPFVFFRGFRGQRIFQSFSVFFSGFRGKKIFKAGQLIACLEIEPRKVSKPPKDSN